MCWLDWLVLCVDAHGVGNLLKYTGEHGRTRHVCMCCVRHRRLRRWIRDHKALHMKYVCVHTIILVMYTSPDIAGIAY